MNTRSGSNSKVRTFIRLMNSESGDEGATIVEMAVTSVIFFAVLFGVIQFSFALYAYNYVNNAAREASRYAMVRGSNHSAACTDPGFATCIAQAGNTGDIQKYVQGLGFPGIDSSKLTVTTTWPGNVGVCSPSIDPCNNPGNSVKVVVSYPFSVGIPFVPLTTLNVSSSSQMVISN